MKTILLVDDSPTLIMSLSSFLRKSSYETRTADSGAGALKLLNGGLKPDLIITDLKMDPMDGIALIREARKIAAIRFVPILMLTTESQISKRTDAKAAGATGWLVKPVDGDALLEVLTLLLPGDDA